MRRNRNKGIEKSRDIYVDVALGQNKSSLLNSNIIVDLNPLLTFYIKIRHYSNHCLGSGALPEIPVPLCNSQMQVKEVECK